MDDPLELELELEPELELPGELELPDPLKEIEDDAGGPTDELLPIGGRGGDDDDELIVVVFLCLPYHRRC